MTSLQNSEPLISRTSTRRTRPTAWLIGPRRPSRASGSTRTTTPTCGSWERWPRSSPAVHPGRGVRGDPSRVGLRSQGHLGPQGLRAAHHRAGQLTEGNSGDTVRLRDAQVVGDARGRHHPRHSHAASQMKAGRGGYQPERNPYFKKFTTRTMRPVVDFDTCVKCTLCWIAVPGLRASTSRPTASTTPTWRRAAAAACARRSARWPTASPWSTKPSSRTTTASGRCGGRTRTATRPGSRRRSRNRPDRSHGFRFRGQYEEQVPDMLKIAREG